MVRRAARNGRWRPRQRGARLELWPGGCSVRPDTRVGPCAADGVPGGRRRRGAAAPGGGAAVCGGARRRGHRRGHPEPRRQRQRCGAGSPAGPPAPRRPVTPGPVGRWSGLCAGVGAQRASVQALLSRNDRRRSVTLLLGTQTCGRGVQCWQLAAVTCARSRLCGHLRTARGARSHLPRQQAWQSACICRTTAWQGPQHSVQAPLGPRAGGDYRPDGANRTATEQHPFHFHGHHFWVLGHGLGLWDASAAARYNLLDPPFRDSYTVFRDGWTAIRFRARPRCPAPARAPWSCARRESESARDLAGT